MTETRYVELYLAFRESGYLRLDGRIPPTPYPTPLAVAVALALRLPPPPRVQERA